MHLPQRRLPFKKEQLPGKGDFIAQNQRKECLQKSLFPAKEDHMPLPSQQVRKNNHQQINKRMTQPFF